MKMKQAKFFSRLKRYKIKEIPIVVLVKILIITGFCRLLPGKFYLKLLYRRVFGKKLNLNSPRTFNEKLQWLKLFDRNPEYTKMADKALAKEYVSGIIGAEYIIPTLGVWNKFDDINFDELPNQFVLKCTHDSGSVYICKDKEQLDIKSLRKLFNKALKKNIFYIAQEWCYKNVKPRIIAEKYMQDGQSGDLKDYKLMCFNGKVKCSFVCLNRFKDGLNVDFYDLDWKKMPFIRKYPDSGTYSKCPKNYELMINFAEKLSIKMSFARIDFYEINGFLYFGEITFYPGSGMEMFVPQEWDYILGNWIHLPSNDK